MVAKYVFLILLLSSFLLHHGVNHMVTWLPPSEPRRINYFSLKIKSCPKVPSGKICTLLHILYNITNLHKCWPKYLSMNTVCIIATIMRCKFKFSYLTIGVEVECVLIFQRWGLVRSAFFLHRSPPR